jgi:phytoene dehydrogenase-like protein
VRSRLNPTASARPLDEATPATPSFMHLHLGIRGDDLGEAELRSIHHISVPEWKELTQPQSAAFVSVPSLLDPALAPPGKHVIHAYLPATGMCMRAAVTRGP